MDQLEQDLEAHKLQLTQINLCIDSSPEQDEDMISLRDDIKQLIALTEQQLLENKKQELLSLLPQESSPPEVRSRDQSVALDKNDSVIEDSLTGAKVRAPFQSKVRGGSTLHNAIITEAFYSDETVRVVYLNPVELAMVACPFFLEGKCKFSAEKCRYSHGEIVSQKDLQFDYQMPDYQLLKEGVSCLAKRENNLVWTHGTCDIVCDDEVLVKFNETVSEKLPISSVYPLFDDSQDDDLIPSDLGVKLSNTSIEGLNEEVIININPSAEKLGDWEQHTRGIGSKLMQKMGYVFGTGLGLRSDGRVKPVPVVVCPLGKSLDWIAEHRGECEGMQLRKEAKKSDRVHRKEHGSSMFNFLNACTSRSVSSSSKPSIQSKVSSDESLNIQSLNQDLAIAKMRQEVQRLKESASRYKHNDPATFKSIQDRLEAKQSKLSSMEIRSSNIDKDKMLARERKRFTTF